jgi:hypothetical protein
MKPRVSSILPALGILCVAATAVPGAIRAQAPPGPLPAAQPQVPPAAANPQNQARPETRTSILGQWKLNLDESDDPRKKIQDANANGSRGGGRGISIAGFPVGGHGGRSGQSDEDQQRMQTAISPANSLTLAQKSAKDPEVDVMEDQNRKLALFTDGRKLAKSDAKDESYEEIAAHWDGSRLVTDEKSPRGGKMSRTYELSYDGAQLFETLRLTVGRSPLDVRYVYDPAPAEAAAPQP